MSDKEVKALITKAAEAKDSADALRFSQAACNVANALFSLHARANNPDKTKE